ncbi:MAG: adenine-specific methyltransferase EcoRI family protein [Patescibacteria group bacterium]
MVKKQGNQNLRKANKAKKDEFYTQLSDIEKELGHYKEHFKGKTVFCNCDDPRVSNFFHYFSYNFENLGLKKLITTCYKNQDVNLFSQNNSEKAIYLEYTGDKNGDKVPNLKEIGIKHLKNDGDFRSEECINLLKQADIVVTNPPFSLFREYVAQLMEYDKKFIIIGNQNAITYKEIFKFIKENKLWLGHSLDGRNIWFRVPNTYEKYHKIEDGVKYAFVASTIWFTNLDHKKRHEDLILYKTYKGNEKDYPKYDNYDAINVDKTADIPVDYKGAMGVPITFLHKYNPEQFEIIGLGISNSGIEIGVRPYKEDHRKYRKEVQKRAAVNGDLYMVENGVVNVPYARILIKNKKIK